MSAGSMGVFADVRESLRYLFADIIGEQDDSIPICRQNFRKRWRWSPARPFIC